MANTPIRVENHDIRITVSIGMAALDGSIRSLDELLSRADQALYIAKERGRNGCEIWEEK
jgi:diguanylate cyclase (GGDEF)-like protein